MGPHHLVTAVTGSNCVVTLPREWSATVQRDDAAFCG